jgi:indole-3-glycerol phosphate synthase
MLSDLLAAMVASARRAARVREVSLEAGAFEQLVSAQTPRADAFRAALRRPGIRVIAECKRRSPSRGILRREYDPAAIASAYEASGAAAISVLTEATFFDGSLDHLRAVRAATSLPILRKDFIVTAFQIAEARAAGADAVLLIVAALDRSTFVSLLGTARAAGLAALVEVHDRAELQLALDGGADTIGVNSRDLRTLEVSPSVFDVLAPEIPAGVVAVAESGLRTGDDVRRLKDLRYDAFLIGERFMTSAEPGAALADLRRSADARLEAQR